MNVVQLAEGKHDHALVALLKGAMEVDQPAAGEIAAESPSTTAYYTRHRLQAQNEVSSSSTTSAHTATTAIVADIESENDHGLTARYEAVQDTWIMCGNWY